jgi:hypothetical protein
MAMISTHDAVKSVDQKVNDPPLAVVVVVVNIVAEPPLLFVHRIAPASPNAT